MGSIKKVISVGFPAVLGLIFILAGLGLINLTQVLLLYIGIALILLSVFYFFKS